MMKAQKWGRIVNTIGGAGKEPDPYMFGSAMTNSALLNLTKSLSEEFGEDNILVNAICPGWVATDLWVRNTEGMKKEFGVASEAEARKIAAKKNSLGRMGKPEELANATVSLLRTRQLHNRRVGEFDGGRLKGLGESAQLAQQLGDLSRLLGCERAQGGSRDVCCNDHRGFCDLPPALGKRDSTATTILWIVEGGDEAAQT